MKRLTLSACPTLTKRLRSHARSKVSSRRSPSAERNRTLHLLLSGKSGFTKSIHFWTSTSLTFYHIRTNEEKITPPVKGEKMKRRKDERTKGRKPHTTRTGLLSEGGQRSEVPCPTPEGKSSSSIQKKTQKLLCTRPYWYSSAPLL